LPFKRCYNLCGSFGDSPLRNILKKIALSVAPVRNVHTDLENRRRRVAELEGHLRVMKKQMAKILKANNSATLSQSQSSSDINHIKGELKKLTGQHKKLKQKYDALYRDYCVMSMSNEALTETNALMLNGDFFNQGNRAKPSPKTAKATPKVTHKRVLKKASETRKAKTLTTHKKTKNSAKAKQK